MRRFYTTLTFKVGAIIIAAEIFVLSVVGFVYVKRFSNEVERRIDAQVQTPGVLMNAGLLNLDTVADRETMEQLVGKGIEDAMVIGVNHNIFFSLNPDYLGKNVEDIPGLDPALLDGVAAPQTIFHDAGNVVCISPIFAIDGRTPQFYLYIKVGTVEADLEKARLGRLFFLGSAATVVFTFAIIIASFHFTILFKLAGAVKVLNRVEAGELSARITGTITKDEIGNLQRGINSTAAQLESTIAKLEQHVIDLEQVKDLLARRAREISSLYESQRQQLKLTQNLREVGALLTTRMSLEQVFERVFDLLADVVKYDSVSVQLSNDQGSMELVSGRGFPDFANAQKVAGIVAEKTVEERFKKQKVTVISDTYADTRWIPGMGQEYIHSWIGAALLVRGKLVGILNVDSATPDAYNETIGETVLAFANQAAIAIENARMFNEIKETGEALQESEARYRSLFEDSPVCLWEENWSQAKQYFDTLKKMGVTDYYRYFQENPQAAEHCLSLIKIMDVNKVGLDFYEALEKKDVLLSLADITAQESRDVLLQEISAVASGQLYFESEDIAVSSTGRKRHVIFRLGVVQGYEKSLGKVLLSVLDIEALKAAEEELRQRNQELIAASEILRLATTPLDINMILDETLRGAVALTGTEGGAICMVDYPALKNLTISASYQIDPQQQQTVDQQLCRRVLETGQPLILADVEAEAIEPTLQNRIRFHGMFPMQIKEETIGILCIFNRSGKGPSNRSLELLRDLCGPIALAIENARLFQRTEQQVQRLTALRDIDTAIVSGLDMRLTLNILISHAVSQLSADAVDVLYCDPETQDLFFVSGLGFHSGGFDKTRLQIGEGLAGKAVEEQTVYYSDDLGREQNFTRKDLLAEEKFIAYVGIPLITKREVKGIMEIFFRRPFDFTGHWLEFLEVLAGQASIAIDNTELFENLQRSNRELSLAYDTTLEGWAKALELRDKETEGHSRRVTDLAIRLAKRLGIGDEHLVHIRRGLLLHDIGKMGVPDHILRKPGPLNQNELNEMRLHPQYARDLLSSIAFLQPALDIPYCHHEKWDGTGYPRGLKGEEIPLAARIFAVVDVWDALLSDRPYRKAWTHKKTMAYIKKEAGTYFDPVIVKAFVEMLAEDENK